MLLPELLELCYDAVEGSDAEEDASRLRPDEPIDHDDLRLTWLDDAARICWGSGAATSSGRALATDSKDVQRRLTADFAAVDGGSGHHWVSDVPTPGNRFLGAEPTPPKTRATRSANGGRTPGGRAQQHVWLQDVPTPGNRYLGMV